MRSAWLKRGLIVVHRWLGVALAVLFLLWFPSGIVMMYWGFPQVTAADRLARAAVLDATTIHLSPAEAYATLDATSRPGQARLATYDGRPVYRFRAGRGERVVYADTGDEQVEVSAALMRRVAARWAGQPISAAVVEPVTEVDQWTVQGAFRNGPLWRFSWPDGQQVYVAEPTGEVVQYTTRASRLAAYFGAIPHWFYFTPLRKDGPVWSRVVIWTSGIGTVTAVLGMVIGAWMYSPSKRYRYKGAATRIPYRGQKRWHMLLGLIFGAGAVTWVFSGMLSMDPFPQASAPGSGARASAAIARALRSAPPLAAFASKGPREALAQVSQPVTEAKLTTVAGTPMYLATLAGGGTRLVPVDGAPRREIDRQEIVDVVTAAAKPVAVADVRVLDQYDRYYLDRRRQQPLPVILVQLADERQSRVYIDPKTARIVGGYDSSNWMDRWLYHGLHSFDFPWLYNYRPLWDIVVITFMTGGTALCVTSLVLAWQVLGRALRRDPAV